MSTATNNNTRSLPSGTWTIDPSTTTVTLSATMLGFIKVPATLTVVSGTIEINDNHELTAVEVVADAASYSSNSRKRNEHVLGADFLDVEKHPHIVFTANSVEPSGSGYRANGSVTVKGQTFPLKLMVNSVDVGQIDAGRGSFQATAAIDRVGVGVDKMPAFVIGRTLQLTVSADATRSDVETEHPISAVSLPTAMKNKEQHNEQ